MPQAEGNCSQVASHTFGDLFFECHEDTHDKFLIHVRSRETAEWVLAELVNVSISPFLRTEVPAPLHHRLARSNIK